MACEDAFRNPLILHHIFENFPTKFLLSSCSFVNKIWNKETRKYIRDNRKCTARISPTGYAALSACQLVQELDQQCIAIIQEGRLIPWNGLSVDFSYCSEPILTRCGDGPISCNLTSDLKLKYLEIVLPSIPTGFSAHHIPLLLLLLRDRADELKSLTVSNIEAYDGILKDFVLEFPRLAEFKISKSDCYVESTAIQMILDNAPNLQRISVKHPSMLKMFQKEKYVLLDELKLEMRTTKDENLYRKVVEMKPNLKALSVDQPTKEFWNDSSEEDYGSDDELNRETLHRKFDSVLEGLLRCCHQSLRLLSIQIEYPLHQLSFPPLVHLSKLRLECESRPQMFWDIISSIEFTRLMPALEHVEIILDESTKEWPISTGRKNVINICHSVRTLKLDHCVKKIDVNLLQPVFPNVESLDFTVKARWGRHKADPPLKAICKAWPKLRELKFGDWNSLKRNFDADFCGIFEQEAKLLRKMDEEYLRAVHIVPIRPCILTMPNLKAFSTHFNFSRPTPFGEGAAPDFISDVTKFVVFDRMPQLENSVTWIFDGYNSSDSDW